MSGAYFTDPAQQFLLQLSNNQNDRNQRLFESMATDPRLMASLVGHSSFLPNASAELNLALAQGGIPVGSMESESLAQLEAQNRANLGPVENPGGGWWDDIGGVLDEWVANPVQGAVRWGFSAWDAAYNMVAGGAPIRAHQMTNLNPGMSFGEAWREQDPYFFEALGGLVAGERVNLGSGFMPQSDVADPVKQSVNDQMMQIEQDTESLGANERYRARLEAAPGVWKNAITDSATAQAQLGKPLTQLHDVQAEAVMFEINDLYGNKRYTPWSPGRVAAAHVVEPGTEPFKYLSGFGDFTSQLVADPVEWAGLGWAKAGRQGRLIWAEGKKVADEVAFGRPALPAGETGFIGPLQDPTREAARQMGAQTALPGRGPYVPGQESGLPWWLSPDNVDGRTTSAFDPPQWYIDHIRTQQNAARGRYAATSKVDGKKTSAHFTRHEPGVYSLATPGDAADIEIVRRGKKWVVKTEDGPLMSVPDDPRFSGTPEFRTLDEAKQAANRYAYGDAPANTTVNGQTVDEFLGTAEEYALDDVVGVTHRGENYKSPRKRTAHVVRNTKSKVPGGKLSNARVRVFGKKLDLSGRSTDGLEQGLVDALRADGRITGGNKIQGFVDPKMDKWDNTIAWMENNGYGKLDGGDGKVIISDKFIGGNGDTADPLARMYFDAGDQPMFSFDDARSATPNEINEFTEFVATEGRLWDEDITRAYGERVQEAARKEGGDGTLGGVRPDTDPKYTIQGKKADTFIDKLVSVSRKAGATDARGVDNLLRFYRKQGVHVPADVRTALFEAQGADEIQQLLGKWMVNGDVPKVTLPGGMGYGRMANVTDMLPRGEFGRLPTSRLTDQHWLQRRFAKALSGDGQNIVEDPSRFYEFVLDALPQYNINRGQEILQFADDGTELLGKVNIEDILTELRTLQPGEKQRAFELSGRLNGALFSSLVGDGVDPRLAKNAARWFDDNGDMALYAAERVGKQHLSNGAKEAYGVAGELVGTNGIELTADMWSGAISVASPRDIKRVANESDMLGKMFNAISSKKTPVKAGDEALVYGMKFEDRVAMKAATFTMNKVWKPFVLLRGAWTLRILMDDQLRMAADGYSMFNHPMRIFNYATTMPKDWLALARKGKVDINGVEFSLKNLDQMKHSELFQNAMMSMRDKATGVGGYGAKHYVPVPKGNPRYAEGLIFEMQRLNGSLTTKMLAQSTADNKVDDIVGWLQGKAAKGDGPAIERANLAQLHKDTPEIAQKILDGDEATLRNVVSRQNAILHHRLGGDVVLDTGNGQLLDFDNYGMVDEIDPTNEPGWVIRNEGDPDLLAIVKENDPSALKLGEDAGVKDLQRLINQKVDVNTKNFPSAVRGPRADFETLGDKSLGDTLNDGMNKLFDIFMTIPSNKLSRSPEFARAYWESMADFFPYADEALKADILAKAPTAQQKVLRAAQKADIDKKLGQITDMDQLDAQAKAYALTRVEQTLFNIMGNKTNIADSLNLVFPFVEAWGEFISRWGRLMVTGDMNIANARRLQQAVEGARGSGFFHENEYGNEVFNYPAFMTTGMAKVHNVLNNLPGASSVLGEDVSPEVAGAVRAQGSVESLNFASGVIPGFGPVIQLGAKQLLPDDPAWDGVRRVISPFGTSGGLANQFAPAWVKRLLSANGGIDDPALTYTYNSTRMDVMRTMADRGDFDGVTDEATMRELLEKVDQEAKGLLAVRAAATFWNPASPSYTFQKEDKTGMVWTYSNLGQEFRRLEEELGDESAAFDVFFERFGFLPTTFSTGRTYSITDRALTTEGSRFERSNPELFDKYPGTAMYIDPDGHLEGEYDHGLMLQQLDQGLREQYTPEQYIYLQHDQLGDLMMDNAEQIAANMQPSQRNEFLAGRKEQISSLYPYWRRPIPGKVQGVTNDQQLAEVREMLQDPSLAGAPALEAARRYEAKRREVEQQIQSLGSTSISGPKSLTTEAGKWATFGRGWLRDYSEELMAQYPEFGPLYRAVYSYEVSTAHDAARPDESFLGDNEQDGVLADVMTQIGGSR